MKCSQIKLIIFALFQFIMLSGCSNNELVKNITHSDINWQIKPDAPQDTMVNNIEVSYSIPSVLLHNKSVSQFLTFKTFHTGRESKQEKLFLRQNGQNLWSIERRTDNGIAGSGVIYDVEVKEEKLKKDMTKVSLVVTREYKYQEGLILPFAVPDFDIRKYLANSQITYEFELDSKYDKESIQDNFQRLLGANYDNIYHFGTGLAEYSNTISLYSYRGGTKIKIKSLIQFVQSDVSIVNVDKIIIDLKNKIKNIVDS